MNNQTNKKRNITLAISGVVTLLLITIGLSFAYFTANITGQETGTTITVGAGTMNIAYSNNSGVITASDIYPKSDPWVTKIFTVAGNNTTDLDMAYSATLIMEENTFSNNALSYTLVSTNTDSNGEVIAPITENITLITGYSINHLGNGYFKKTEGSKTHTYTLKVYFLDIGENQNLDQGKTFNGYISMSGIECADCLTDNLLASAGGKELINTSVTPDFSQIAPGNPIGYTEKTPVEVTSNIPSVDTLIGVGYTLGANAYQIQNSSEKWDNTYSQSDIGMYICDSGEWADNYYLLDIDGCNTIYQIKEVSGTTVTKAIRYEIDKPIYDSSKSGIFVTEDDYGRSYYYRGLVENNYVVFANMCWRIVRVVGDGSIKLVLYNYNPNLVENPCDQSQDGDTNAFARYSGETYTSAFNTNSNDAKYVGYMYSPSGTVASENATEAQTNEVNSTIKDNIEIWYDNNLSTYSNYLADTLWCNDREIDSGDGFGTNMTFYKSNNRLEMNKTPSLKCSQKNDRFTVSDKKHGNGKAGVPVGLLTADEISFAGGVLSQSHRSQKNYYLYKNSSGSSWWTSSPFVVSSGSYIIGVDTFGSSFPNSLEFEKGIRPSISLKSNTKITGLGTSLNPYKVI